MCVHRDQANMTKQNCMCVHRDQANMTKGW